MDEVKIWAIDTTTAVPLESKGQMDTEWSLEDTLVKNPSLLMPGLTLVGRQMPTEGGPLDLLGVDSDGKLAVFELKRGTLSRDAVAQIIDYASDLDRMELGALAEHISERSGEHDIAKIEDFEEWYTQKFDQGLEPLRPLRLYLVGLGADDRTERMVTFLADNSGMDISLLTFHGFTHQGKTLLAKQVHVEGVADSKPQPARRRKSQAEHRAQLERRIEESGVRELFDAATRMFRDNWPQSGTRIGAYGLEIFLTRPGARGRPRYARLGAVSGMVQIMFYPAAKALCLNEFRRPVAEIQYITWPESRDPLDPNTEIKFQLTAKEWETHKETLTSLTKAVYAAWESIGQDDGVDSAQPVDVGA